jgi:hypothetical protein
MALTNNSPIFARFHESGFNTIINEMMLQRPKLFNYATDAVLRYNSLCSPIVIDPILDSMGIEKCTVVDKLPIIGLTGASDGIDFCAQIAELKIDFQPSNQIQLPPELGSLTLQEFSLKGRFCAGISCGGVIRSVKPNRRLEDLKTVKENSSRKSDDLKDVQGTGLIFRPFFETLNMMCFCLDLFAKVVLVRENSFLKLKLVGIELQDISPLGLENSMECYLKQVLDSVIFPKMKLALSDLVFNAGSYFSIGLSPISAAIPSNPNISNDNISLFINLI